MSKAAVDQRMGDPSLRSFIPNAFLGKGTARAISALPVTAVCECVCVCGVRDKYSLGKDSVTALLYFLNSEEEF